MLVVSRSVAVTAAGADPCPAATNARTASAVRPQSLVVPTGAGIAAPLAPSWPDSQVSAGRACGVGAGAAAPAPSTVPAAPKSSPAHVVATAATFIREIRLTWVICTSWPTALEVRRARRAPGLRHPQSTTDSSKHPPRGAIRLAGGRCRCGRRSPTHGCGTAPEFDRLSSPQTGELLNGQVHHPRSNAASLVAGNSAGKGAVALESAVRWSRVEWGRDGRVGGVSRRASGRRSRPLAHLAESRTPPSRSVWSTRSTGPDRPTAAASARTGS